MRLFPKPSIALSLGPCAHLRQALCSEASLCVIDLPSSNSRPGMPLGFPICCGAARTALGIQSRPQDWGHACIGGLIRWLVRGAAAKRACFRRNQQRLGEGIRVPDCSATVRPGRPEWVPSRVERGQRRGNIPQRLTRAATNGCNTRRRPGPANSGGSG